MPRVVIWQQWKSPVQWKMSARHSKVQKVGTSGPPLLLPSSQEELFSIKTYLFFFPPLPRSSTRRLSTYLMLYFILGFTGGGSFNHTFPEEILIFVGNLKLVTLYLWPLIPNNLLLLSSTYLFTKLLSPWQI